MSSRSGNRKENRVRDEWADLGWFAMCGRASRGPADVVCVKVGEKPRLIQVKGDKDRYENFRPEERRLLVETAAQAGGIALLAWWPPKAPRPTYIPWHQWPAPRST